MTRLPTKKIHRRFPERDWDYKALSHRIRRHGKSMDVIYSTLKNKGRITKSVEVYSGRNYIVGSSDASYSRRYGLRNIPKYLIPIVEKLKKQHSKTKWSKKKRVNLN